MHLKSLELQGFKSFGRKAALRFDVPVVAVVGPNGSGKSNVVEAFRFALGEQSVKSMRGRRGEDLIWHGSPELPRGGKATVKLTFDNRDRALPLDFDDVSLERTVHRDGVNEYSVNGTPTRLRDTLEILAAANIGPSGHHIVSQGEADRVLSATPKERREILQDALGLRALEWKRAEALRKLEKTDANAAQVRSLLAELEPHLRFLRRQVEKVERAERLRQELLERYRAYLALESARVRVARARAIEALRAPNDEKERVASQIRDEEMRASRAEAPAVPEGLVEAESALAASRERSRRLSREIGAAEGELSALERMSQSAAPAAPRSPDDRPVPRNRVRAALEAAKDGLRRASAAATFDVAYEALGEAVAAIESLVAEEAHVEEAVPERPDFSVRAAEVGARLGELRAEVAAAEADERRAEAAAVELRAARDAARVDVAEAERALVGLVSRKGELEREIDRLAAEARQADTDEETLRSEMQEAVALVGREALDFEAALEAAPVDEPREATLARRKELERMKLRLEEAGAAGGEELLKEHADAVARDEFLRKEVGDLEASAATLTALIEDLERKVGERFSEGLKKVNEAFGELFVAMFGGGRAELRLTKIEKRRRASDEDLADVGELPAEEAEEGVEVHVELPKKRVSGLLQLSGGERSLVSIALLFAMSRVAPPPFVILDETDAALDEANSRRYGDMIEKLAEKSQLVLITHNRETMSRAGALYGVTAGAAGSSLLSVKFDDAAAMAAR